MRFEYGNIFKAHQRAEEKEARKKEAAGKDYKEPKMHTITYQANLLTSMEEEDGCSLISALASSTED